MVKQKKSMDSGSKGERADWKDPKELEAFCRFCAVQVMNGQRKATEFLSKIGVNEVIRQLGEMGKVVTWVQIKNKWDNLRKRWKTYNKCMNNETGLGYDAGTGIFDTPDEWWNRKIAACPDAKTFKMYGLPNRDLLNIMFRGTVATGRNAFCTSGPIPTETNEGSGDSADSVEFVDPQCEPVVNVDAMEVEGPSLSRAGPAVNKGKGLGSKKQLVKRAIQLLVEDTDTANSMGHSSDVVMKIMDAKMPPTWLSLGMLM
nr:L10-interacting MYB domain-containing protein-like [Quercus suber]